MPQADSISASDFLPKISEISIFFPQSCFLPEIPGQGDLRFFVLPVNFSEEGDRNGRKYL